MSSTNHHRRSIRLPEYNYSCAGEYFVTICIHQRECLLGNIVDDCMMLNDLGQCVDSYWKELPSHYDQLSLGEWTIMPNHVHGILIIDDIGVGAIHELPLHELPKIELPMQDSADTNVGAIHELPLHEPTFHGLPKQQRRNMLLFKIIGRFKMNSGKQINIMRGTSGQPLWQRNYYEHIIRDARSYINIENYIRNNPLNWAEDKDNPNKRRGNS